MCPRRRAELRAAYGQQNILAEMRLQDTGRYTNYLRMSDKSFQKLLELVGPSIAKRDNWANKPIDPSTRLAITVR